MIKKLKTPIKAENTNLNKSTSALETQLEGKQKRKRTKSWTTLTVSNENNFYSDNEDVKKKLRERTNGRISLDQTNKLNSSDGLNTSFGQNINDKSFLKKKKNNRNNFVAENINTSLRDSNNQTMNEKNDEKSSVSLNNSQKNYASETIKLFEKDPSANIHTTVFIEDDSDTNSGKVNTQNRYEHEDQCVPEVEHTNQLEKNSSQISVSSGKLSNIVNKSKSGAILNDSCEPMDIDETIPENLVISEVNSSSPVVLLERSISKGRNTSGRKSSLSQNVNKSGNENKSTLILSQLKDSSSTDINNVTKSPQNKDIYLKATDDLNTSQENDANKRNLSLNYVTTSTPLQQNKLTKLSNINTSIIACNNGVKDVETNKLNQSKNENKVSNKVENETATNKLVLNNSVSDNNKSNNEMDKSASKNEHISNKYSAKDSDSEEELHNHENENQKGKNNSFTKIPSQSNTLNDTDSDDEESHNTSNLLDDKAEDAGDDYESGDSLDENARQYLKENEILEKGETLSSENELSNDSDYEKDSFVVSSDEEDNELLEGTEDDLSMSDNELKMTAKSKKKFNERKKKEQKNASREMFESRHKLNKSNSSETGKLKKPIQQQSSSESEDETEIKTKKHNRMRLDSSQEVSLLEDKNEQKVRKKKSKRLSESICDDNALNENEITVCNEGLKETNPLSSSLKDEPKTPQKADASIAFINSDDPNVQNDLTKTQTEIEDPLEDSMAEDESLSSENENIIQNYDSVLEGLKKTNKAKSKECDISLNIDKKQNKKKNMAIVDELNLTQVKSTKKLKNISKQKKSIAENETSKLDLDDSASSDSIDLQLLFSEDSNSSDNIKNKPNISSSNKERFVPLKNTEGNTNIRENIGNF